MVWSTIGTIEPGINWTRLAFPVAVDQIFRLYFNFQPNLEEYAKGYFRLREVYEELATGDKYFTLSVPVSPQEGYFVFSVANSLVEAVTNDPVIYLEACKIITQRQNQYNIADGGYLITIERYIP